MIRIFAAAALYFSTVFGVGFALGPIRVLVLEPRIGPFAAVLCEAPFLLGAIVFASRWAPRVCALAPTPVALMSVGLVALVLQQLADLALGLTLRGITPSQQIAQFAKPAGMVYGALLVLFALMPLLANRVGTRKVKSPAR